LQTGLWHWEAVHPEWGPGDSSLKWEHQEVSSYAIDDGDRLLLFDPLAVPSEIEGFQVGSLYDFEALCRGLEGLQREACITAAAVIGPPDPTDQLQLCAGLAAPTDAANCVRGTKVQNLLGRPPAVYVELIGRCELFAGVTRAACYRWLGKDPRRPDRRRIRADRLSAAGGRGRAPGVPRRRTKAGRAARNVQLTSTVPPFLLFRHQS
jgi:hypothetical protein